MEVSVFLSCEKGRVGRESWMTFSQWLFGGIENPFKAGQWGALHIATLLVCTGLIVGFYHIVRHSRNQERSKKRIVYSLTSAILFFEIMIRFVQCMKLYYFHQPEMEGITLVWIILPKPWCAISCWALIASVFVKKRFFYDFASLSALLCSFIFFIYPGVGYNNEHLLFENWYSILTHALLLVTSITLMTLKIADFKYRELWKTAVCFALTVVYGFLEIFVLHIQTDPLYFMPHGDIQEGILGMDYGLYLFFYVLLLIIYINTAYLIGDKLTMLRFLSGKTRVWQPLCRSSRKS